MVGRNRTNYEHGIDEGFGDYMRAIRENPGGRYSTIDAQREIELSRQIRAWLDSPSPSPECVQAGKRAKQRLMEANLRLVVHVAKQYNGNGLELMDLVQEGNIGLATAAEKFDYSKGFKFSTYAYWWIRQNMTRALHERSRPIRLPIHACEKLLKAQKLRQIFRQIEGRYPTERELAIALLSGDWGKDVEYSEDKIERMVANLRTYRHMGAFIMSLDQPIGFGGEADTPLMDVLLDPNSDVEAELERLDTTTLLVQCFKDLSPAEVTVMQMRYGLDDGQAKTLAVIGDKLSLSRERVRQIQSAALRKLRGRVNRVARAKEPLLAAK